MRCVALDADDCGHAMGTEVTPAASANLGDTPMMTMSRMLLARKQSLGSHVTDSTVLSVAWRRFTTRLEAACHEEQTHRGHNMRFGVINTPVHRLDPCSQARPAVTSAVAWSLAEAVDTGLFDGKWDIMAHGERAVFDDITALK